MSDKSKRTSERKMEEKSNESNDSKKSKKSRRSTAKTIPTGVQAHGKILENQIIAVIVAPDKLAEAMNQPYTAVHDIPGHLNQYSPDANISIKVTGANRVDFGDAMRVINILDKGHERVEVIVVMYKQQGTQKVPEKVIRFDFSKAGGVLFGKPITDELKAKITQLSDMLKRGEEYKDLAKELQKEMKDNKSYMVLAPKVGNKEKKRAGRLQISLSRFKEFIKEMEEIDSSEHKGLILENSGCKVYGKECLTVLESERRVLTKK